MPTDIPLQLTSVVQRVPRVLFSALDDERLAIDAEANYCYSLNEVAGRVWDLIEKPASVAEVCVQLRQAYAVDEVTCQHEVLELLQRLTEAGLVNLVKP